MYSLYLGNNQSLTSSQIIESLNSSNPLQAAHIQAIRNLGRNGCRYSNQDCDVLSAAATVARTGRLEAREWEAGWIKAMTGK